MRFENHRIAVEEFYIPEKIKIGKGKVENHAAITFKNSNGAWLQPSYFQRTCGFPCIDKPRDSEITIKRDISNSVQLIKNEPTTGFRLINIVPTLDDDSSVWIEDPRGWQFRIILPRFIKWMNKGMVVGENKVIGGSWVYACYPSSREILIVNTEWPDYQKSIKEVDLQQLQTTIKSSMKKKNLEIGKVYRIYQSRDLHDSKFDRAVYLGEWSNVSDLKKFYTMMVNATSEGYYCERDHQEARKHQEEILSKLSTPKMVFFKLSDQIISNQTKYDGTSFSLNEEFVSSNKRQDRHNLVVYMDSVIAGHNEFSFRFDWFNWEKSCLYVCSALDNMIVRGLDPNQEYKIIEPWMRNIVPKRGYYSGWSNRTDRWNVIDSYCIMNHINQTTVTPDWYHYQTYTIGELNNFVSYIINQIMLPYIKNPPYGVKKC